MLKKIKLFYPLNIFLFFNLLALKASAQVDWNPNDTGLGGGEPRLGGGTPTVQELPNPLGNREIIDIINSVLNYLIYISVPIVAFMILWGGFQILTARDDPEKVKNGRKTIQWASVGFAVILISKGVALILLKILKG